MFSLLLTLSISIRYEEFDLVQTIPGNWTHFGDNKFSIFFVPEEENTKTETPTFTGFYNDTQIQITVTSKDEISAKFGDISFSLKFALSLEGTAFADTILTDGTHLTAGVFSRTNCEFTLVDKDNNSFQVYGFRKIDNRPYTWQDFCIPTGIAIVLMVVLRKFAHIAF